MDVNKELKFLGKFKKKIIFFGGGSGGGGEGWGGGVRVNVNKELKILGKFMYLKKEKEKKKIDRAGI